MWERYIVRQEIKANLSVARSFENRHDLSLNMQRYSASYLLRDLGTFSTMFSAVPHLRSKFSFQN